MNTDQEPREPDTSVVLTEFAAKLGATLLPTESERLLHYLDAMLDENTRMNLTAVRERDAALALHACDALGAALAGQEFGKALDLGTGNGFPGIALCCLDPSAEVTFMDRTQKKVRAIERCLALVGLEAPRAVAIAADAVQAPAHGMRASFDTVVARAVGEPVAVARLAGPLLHRRGRLLLWCSSDQELPDKLRPGFGKRGVFEYELPAPADRTRVLALYARG